MFYSHLESPIGRILVAGDRSGLRLISFPTGVQKRGPEHEWEEREAPLRQALDQLSAYFAGDLKQFDLSLAPEGTPFQKTVWTALRAIPYGETISYGELARTIGRPRASRAVGAANGQNPLPIVIPCHRVIGANGALTGFGGGIETKQALLALEQGATNCKRSAQ